MPICIEWLSGKRSAFNGGDAGDVWKTWVHLMEDSGVREISRANILTWKISWKERSVRMLSPKSQNTWLSMLWKQCAAWSFFPQQNSDVYPRVWPTDSSPDFQFVWMFQHFLSGYVLSLVRICHTEHSSNQSIPASTAPGEYTLKWL